MAARAVQNLKHTEMKLINEYEYYRRVLPDGRLVTIIPLLGFRARLHIGPDAPWFNDGW